MIKLLPQAICTIQIKRAKTKLIELLKENVQAIPRERRAKDFEIFFTTWIININSCLTNFKMS